MHAILLALQALTNLGSVPAGPGLPTGWDLRVPRGARAARFTVMPDGALGVEGDGAAGFASYQLPEPLPARAGVLTWRWRTATPLADAELRDRERDDSPARVFVIFADRRSLFYTWGNGELPGAAFASWTGRARQVIVLRNARAADGDWRHERRDPFADYQRLFGRAPPDLVAVGVALDTDQLGGTARAEIARIAWEPPDP